MVYLGAHYSESVKGKHSKRKLHTLIMNKVKLFLKESKASLPAS